MPSPGRPRSRALQQNGAPGYLLSLTEQAARPVIHAGIKNQELFDAVGTASAGLRRGHQRLRNSAEPAEGVCDPAGGAEAGLQRIVQETADQSPSLSSMARTMRAEYCRPSRSSSDSGTGSIIRSSETSSAGIMTCLFVLSSLP